MIKNIENFFGELEIYEDIHNGQKYKKNIFNSIKEFLENKTINNAEEVYKNFFEAYWIGIQEKSENPFLEILNKMHEYEKYGGKIVTKQRDHFMHSVEVFILGIAIFYNNKKMQVQFDTFIENSNYHNYYNTKYEEFFYRWGITALFHDVAYPIEIISEQLKRYAKLLDSYSIQEDNLNLIIKFEGIENFNIIDELKIKDKYKEEFKRRNPDLNLKEYTSCIEILTKTISRRFSLDEKFVKYLIRKKLKDMESGKYIDHGFYSAIIVLKWYHSLIERTGWDPSYFIYPIVDVATAILLHNVFSRDLLDKTGKMEFKEYPIAFLLILCDELEEWDRINFSTNIVDTKSTIDIKNNKINVKYYSNNEKLENKYKKVNSILQLDNLLELNINIEKKGDEEK